MSVRSCINRQDVTANVCGPEQGTGETKYTDQVKCELPVTAHVQTTTSMLLNNLKSITIITERFTHSIDLPISDVYKYLGTTIKARFLISV